MTVALDETLIAKGISSLNYKGEYKRILDRLTASADDIFIGAIVTGSGCAAGYCDIAAEDDPIMGQVLGYNPAWETIDTEGYYYRDYDHCFAASKWVRVGVLDKGMVVLVLSGTNKTITIEEYLKVVDGCLEMADTGDDLRFRAIESVTGASNTRKYFYAEVC